MNQKNKGFFSAARLPVAHVYPKPMSRAGFLLIGLVAGLVVVALAIFDYYADHAALLQNGPLSSAHASLESDCTSCHVRGGGTPDTLCQDCHERFGEPAVYGFASHYLYRDNDFTEVADHEGEQACADCHHEHHGRDSVPITVANSHCASCHAWNDLDDHEPWMAAASGAREPAPLTFPHIIHVRELMDRNDWQEPEQTCASCHRPDSDGRGFEPLSFDEHCDACHLTDSTATPRLAIARDGEIGVATLATILSGGAPGTHWSRFANPGEYTTTGNRLVTKSPLHHADPWIMHNLRRVRQALYENAPLADLLRTTGQVEAGDSRAVYREAIETLEGYALGLRARADEKIQNELTLIEGILADLGELIENPYAPLDETRFLLDLVPNRDLSEPDAEEWQSLAADLTESCTPCHQVRDATIVRVNPDQSSLRQATFDHRAHILERGCLDCHNGIPIREAIAGADVPAEADVAEILNLPDLASCQECHGGDKTADTCITCHEFHPEKQRRGRMVFHAREEQR